jgi:hypothetical protein
MSRPPAAGSYITTAGRRKHRRRAGVYNATKRRMSYCVAPEDASELATAGPVKCQCRFCSSARTLGEAERLRDQVSVMYLARIIELVDAPPPALSRNDIADRFGAGAAMFTSFLATVRRME